MRKLSHPEIALQRVAKENITRASRIPIIGMLDNIRSLYNVGSIFRTSDGGLIDRLFLTGHTPTPPRREIDKTALGATETIPWEHFPDPLDGIRAARERGAMVLVLEHTTDSKPYDAPAHISFPVCLVVGNELTGVSPAVVSQADMAWEIPMYGSKQSLNAAVAYGIAVFELVRRWRASR
jgi:tRNA G18 (ribose-2'-O)-methylase SpoU